MVRNIFLLVLHYTEYVEVYVLKRDVSHDEGRHKIKLPSSIIGTVSSMAMLGQFIGILPTTRQQVPYRAGISLFPLIYLDSMVPECCLKFSSCSREIFIE